MIENAGEKVADQGRCAMAVGPHFVDRPASHAVAHAEDEVCACHGETEAEIAMPYALLAFSLPALAIIGALVGWALR
jgi:hypothetical protein